MLTSECQVLPQWVSMCVRIELITSGRRMAELVEPLVFVISVGYPNSGSNFEMGAVTADTDRSAGHLP